MFGTCDKLSLLFYTADIDLNKITLFNNEFKCKFCSLLLLIRVMMTAQNSLVSQKEMAQWKEIEEMVAVATASIYSLS